MNVDEAINGRRAVRDYIDKAVDERSIRGLIDAAINAPSAFNQQPWMFTVIRDQAMLDRISREAKTHMLATMPSNPQSEHLKSMLGNPDFHIFYHAPVLILISASSQGPWIAEDCALAAENLMLAAYSADLGTCWIGFAQSFLNTTGGQALLGVPAASVAIAPIIAGHPKTQPPPVPRRAAEIRWIG